MATSGSTNFTETRDEIIEDALRLAGVLDITESPSGPVSEAADRALDSYLKYLMARGLQLWRQTEGVLFLVEGQESYGLGSTGDEATRVSDLVATALNGAAATSATALTVDLTTGMAIGDRIGIELATGIRHWTTILTIPTSATLTITTGLASAASDNATVYTYTTKIERPLRISNVRSRDTDGLESPLASVSRQEYMGQPDKAADGKPVMVHYSPQLANGTLYVWPTADDVTDQIRFTFERIIEDVDTGDDNFDLPVECLEPLKYGLGLRLAHKYGKLDRIQYLKPEAEEKEARMLNFDAEDTSVFVQPDSQ